MKWKNIESQILSIGARGKMLPPERNLCEKLGVSRTTLRKSLHSLMKEGKVHKLQGKGSFVIDKDDESPFSSFFRKTPVALCMQSFLAPFIAKTLSGWDDHMSHSHFGYIIHGFIQPHQQLDILKELSEKVKILALHFLPWTRKSLSPMPLLDKFDGTILFLLDRHYEYPELGYAVISDESKGLELAFNYITGEMAGESRLIYFHRSNTPFQSVRTRNILLPKIAARYGIDLETVNISFRIRNKLKAYFRNRSKKHIYALCSDSMMADDILHTCSELGIHYGKDLTLVSLFESSTSMHIPHVSANFYSIGAKAASLAIDIQNGKHPNGKTLLVPPSFSAK